VVAPSTLLFDGHFWLQADALSTCSRLPTAAWMTPNTNPNVGSARHHARFTATLSLLLYGVSTDERRFVNAVWEFTNLGHQLLLQ
jgi:hypothetical protein